MSKNVQAKKVKKTRKQLSPQAKRNLGNLLGSLFSNQRAIDGAKEMPIWVAIIFMLLSAFLPVIPTMVNTSKSYGSSFVATNTYNLDVTLPTLTKELKDDGAEFVIDHNSHKLLGYRDFDNGTLYDPYMTEPIAKYTNATTGEYELFVYYSQAKMTSSDTTDPTTFAYLKNVVLNKKFIKGSTVPGTETEGEEHYSPSFVILHETRIYVYLYQQSTTSALTSNYDGCNWNNYTGTTKLLTRVTEGADASKPIEFNKKVFSNWKVVFDESYLSQRDFTLLTSTFIYFGIYLGLIIFLGLMVFLLTRGKKNIFRYLKFFTCEKIAAWAAFSPALISFVLGFVFSSQAVMFFIMLVGVRTMWLTMKQLRPQQY